MPSFVTVFEGTFRLIASLKNTCQILPLRSRTEGTADTGVIKNKNRNEGSPALALPCGPGQEAMILLDNRG